MAKPLAPEVLALIPSGIEKLVLRCVVCGGPLPSSRRTVGDHAGACHKVRTLYRRYVIQLTKCIACLHPATPEEREEFKQWRVSRGDLRGRGNRQGGRRRRIDHKQPRPEQIMGRPPHHAPNCTLAETGASKGCPRCEYEAKRAWQVPDLPTHNPAMQVDTQAGDSVACEVSSTTES